MLPKLILEKKRFDLILIDGGHSYNIAKSDIENSLSLINNEGVIVIDNLETKSSHAGSKRFR